MTELDLEEMAYQAFIQECFKEGMPVEFCYKGGDIWKPFTKINLPFHFNEYNYRINKL